MYEAGHPVPYLAFMQIFRELVSDPVAVTPIEPSPGRKPAFRAACMAASVGLVDNEGRDVERLQEFHDKIYSYWKAKLPPEEFAEFARIYERGRGGSEDEDTGTPATVTPTAKNLGLLQRLKIVDNNGRGVTSKTEAERRETGADDAVAPPVFASVDDLARAIRQGDLRVEFSPLAVKKELAVYKLGEVSVGVRCAWGKKSDANNHVVLTARYGLTDSARGRDELDAIVADMGYVKQSARAYRRWDDDYGYTVNVGPRMINLAISAPREGAVENTPVRIQRGHRDLGELLERLQA